MTTIEAKEQIEILQKRIDELREQANGYDLCEAVFEAQFFLSKLNSLRQGEDLNGEWVFRWLI